MSDRAWFKNLSFSGFLSRPFPPRKEQFQDGGNSSKVTALLEGQVYRLSAEKYPGVFVGTLFIHSRNNYWESLKCRDRCLSGRGRGWKKVEILGENCSVKKFDCKEDSDTALNVGKSVFCMCEVWEVLFIFHMLRRKSHSKGKVYDKIKLVIDWFIKDPKECKEMGTSLLDCTQLIM